MLGVDLKLSSLALGSLGGAGIPAPPAGYGYLFVNDNSGNPQIVFVTDANGISWPILIPGGS